MSEALMLESVIGFEGGVRAGLLFHRDGLLIYPLGATIVVREISNSASQDFLQGHSDKISCLALSRSGSYLASGQVTFMGFTADIIVWAFYERSILHKMSLHKVKVQSLSFSPDDSYLASLGGQDDNSLVVWNVSSGEPVCGSPISNDHVLTVQFLNDNKKVVTGGNYNLHVWDFDSVGRKIRPTSCELGQLKRVCQAIAVDEYDKYMFVGTTTGDLLQVVLQTKLFKNAGPGKHRVPQGILCTAVASTGMVVCGGGDGSCILVDSETMKTVLSLNLRQGAITTVAPGHATADGSFEFYCGTSQCNIFRVLYDASAGRLIPTLAQTCHFQPINDIAFPFCYGKVFATCSTTDIRVWQVETTRELLRIQVPNLVCNCVAFTRDGVAIISGWSDGKIRAFGPQSGKLLFTIHDAHVQGVTAIVGTSDCLRIVSGGKEGTVRVWRIGPQSQSMIASMKEHKGAVNFIAMRKDDSECVSASSDGSCIIWDLTRFARNNSLFASTFFKAALYHPDESQIVTTGSDRKITWWDAFDGQAIRILEGSDSAEINSLDVSSDGQVVVSGGGDRDVKLWGYDEGHCYFVGKGHSEAVSKVVITPELDHIISVGNEGAIFIWEYKQPN